MDGDGSFGQEATRRRVGCIAVPGEGSLDRCLRCASGVPLLGWIGEAHIAARPRDEAELFGVLERLRDLGAALVSVSIDR